MSIPHFYEKYLFILFLILMETRESKIISWRVWQVDAEGRSWVFLKKRRAWCSLLTLLKTIFLFCFCFSWKE